MPIDLSIKVIKDIAAGVSCPHPIVLMSTDVPLAV